MEEDPRGVQSPIVFAQGGYGGAGRSKRHVNHSDGGILGSPSLRYHTSAESSSLSDVSRPST